jgi:hypothetical protein
VLVHVPRIEWRAKARWLRAAADRAAGRRESATFRARSPPSREPCPGAARLLDSRRTMEPFVRLVRERLRSSSPPVDERPPPIGRPLPPGHSPTTVAKPWRWPSGRALACG